jgi:methionyl-tRNA synthetase
LARVMAMSVHVILCVVANLKRILAPILPHTPVLAHRTQKLHEFLGYEGQPFGSAQDMLFGTQQVVEYEEETRSHEALTYDHSGAVGTWTKSELPPGQALREPAPLFKKLDESVVEEEYARLEG